MRWSVALAAIAEIVAAGFTQELVTKELPSTIKRLEMS